jgi:hypothetical protein
VSTTDGGVTHVRVNRLKDSWTWNVEVAAGGNTPEQLEEAKIAALRIAYELRD